VVASRLPAKFLLATGQEIIKTGYCLMALAYRLVKPEK
jgi:hypothetical protein